LNFNHMGVLLYLMLHDRKRLSLQGMSRVGDAHLTRMCFYVCFLRTT
jgi:hypothetical protein